MEAINTNDYFVESKKAIQLVLDREEELSRKLKAHERLQLVKKHKDSAKTAEEYEELEQHEKELERKIRFRQLSEPAIPEQHREKVLRNLKTEQLQQAEKLNELKGQLAEQISYMKENIIPLLKSIHDLEAMDKVTDQVNIILDAEIGENVPLPVYARIKPFVSQGYVPRAGMALRDAQKAVDELSKITVPIETTGLLSFLKRGRK